jgi:hypothetical protein
MQIWLTVGETLIEYISDAKNITATQVDGWRLKPHVEYRLRADDPYNYRNELRLLEELAVLDATVRRVEEDIIEQSGVQVDPRVVEAIACKNQKRGLLNEIWMDKPEPLPSIDA